MKCISGRRRLGVIGGTLGALLLLPCASAGGRPKHPYRYSVVDMPVSLAVGTVRTPEFAVKHQAYDIMIQAEKRLPFRDMQCLMGLMSGPTAIGECSKVPVLQADWTVWDGEHIVAQGTNQTEGDAEYTNKYLFKFIGQFMGETGKKYVVEVKFTKDGTPLNACNPHLIVILVSLH